MNSFLNQNMSVSFSGLADIKEGEGDKNEINEVKNGFISFYSFGRNVFKVEGAKGFMIS